MFEVHGSLFFGAVGQFTESMQILERKPGVLILETSHLLAIDATGLGATCRPDGFRVYGIHNQPLFALAQSGLLGRIGNVNICGSLAEALERARGFIGQRVTGK